MRYKHYLSSTNTRFIMENNVIVIYFFWLPIHGHILNNRFYSGFLLFPLGMFSRLGG